MVVTPLLSTNLSESVRAVKEDEIASNANFRVKENTDSAQIPTLEGWMGPLM